MNESRLFSRYLGWLLAAVVLGCLLVTALVVSIDPYRLYQRVQIPGWTSLRPAPEHFQEEIKLTVARKLGANVVVLGNSRAEWGIDPAPLARDKGEVAYNLAISGSGIHTSRSELAYLQSVQALPQRIVLGMEFLDFPVDGDGRPDRADTPASGFPIDGYKWRFDTLFSMTALADSLTTIRVQRGLETTLVTANGYNPMLEYAKYARDEGYYAIFRQRAEEYASSFQRKPRALVYRATGSSPAWDDLRSMLALAGQHQRTLQLIIYPYHAQLLALFEQAGLWPLFEQWKQRLAEEVAQAQRQYPDSHISLWDFSGFSPYQCEAIPAKGDRHRVTRWYWEAGHFKQSLGALILQRLNAGAPAERSGEGAAAALPFDLLTPATLAQNRQRIAAERAVCLQAQPGIFSDAQALVARAARNGS